MKKIKEGDIVARKSYDKDILFSVKKIIKNQKGEIDMKISYSKKGDYYIPNLIPPRNMKGFQLGKYSALRLRYLKEHKKAKYHSLIMDNELQKHLMDVQNNCEKLYKKLINELKIKENITEELKANDQMEWVKRMNNISNIADEIVLNMYVYNNEN